MEQTRVRAEVQEWLATNRPLRLSERRWTEARLRSLVVQRTATLEVSDDVNAGTHRSLLRSIGPELTTKAPWEHRPEGLSRRQPAEPYRPEEVEGLLRAVKQQRTTVPARSLQVFLALG